MAKNKSRKMQNKEVVRENEAQSWAFLGVK